MRFKLLGVNVDSLSEAEIHERTAKLSSEKRTSQIVLLDTYLLMKAQFSKELKNIINSCDMVIPISGGIKFGLKFFKVKLDTVYNFFSFIIRLVTYLTDYNKNIYLLGGTERSIVRAEKNIKGSFPGIRLMGRFHVKYRKEFEGNLITAIQKTSPAMTIVSMTRPKQEKWIYRVRKEFKEGVFIGIENFVDIIGDIDPSGKKTGTGSRRRSIIIKNPFRIFYYILYFILLVIYKIFKLG